MCPASLDDFKFIPQKRNTPIPNPSFPTGKPPPPNISYLVSPISYLKNQASTLMNWNVVTSNNPISVSLISGITARDMKHRVITGSTSRWMPSWV